MKQVDVGQPQMTSLPVFLHCLARPCLCSKSQVSDCIWLHRYQTFCCSWEPHLLEHSYTSPRISRSFSCERLQRYFMDHYSSLTHLSCCGEVIWESLSSHMSPCLGWCEFTQVLSIRYIQRSTLSLSPGISRIFQQKCKNQCEPGSKILIIQTCHLALETDVYVKRYQQIPPVNLGKRLIQYKPLLTTVWKTENRLERSK